jgi:predicted RNA-binding protein Jag
MKKDVLRRLDALERQRVKNQKAAERQCFLNAASRIVLAYYLGGLKPKECPWEGYARALKFQNSDDLFRALVEALQTGNAAELRSRHDDALRRLFSEFHYDRSSQEALDEAITKMAKHLPDQWRAWITELVEEVDYDKEIQEEERAEQILSTAELIAAGKARARSWNEEFA